MHTVWHTVWHTMQNPPESDLDQEERGGGHLSQRKPITYWGYSFIYFVIMLFVFGIIGGIYEDLSPDR